MGHGANKEYADRVIREVLDEWDREEKLKRMDPVEYARTHGAEEAGGR